MPDRRAQACAAAIALLCHAASAAPTESDLSAWWEAEVASAQSLAPYHGFKVEWISYALHVPTAEEVQRIRERVEGKPDHPDRRILKVFDERASGVAPEHFTAWIVSDTEWRLEQSEPDGKVVRALSRDRRIAWDASGVRLVIVDEDKPFPATAESLFDTHNDMLPLRYFAFQAAGLRQLRNATNMRTRIRSGNEPSVLSWTHDGAGKIWEVYVSGSDQAGGFRADFYRSDDGTVENSFSFDRRTRFDGLDRELTALVDWTASDYIHSKTFELQSVEPFDIGDFPGLEPPGPDELPALPGHLEGLGLRPTIQDFRGGGIDRLPPESVVVVDTDAEDPADRYRQIPAQQPKSPLMKNRTALLLGAAGLVAIAAFTISRLRSRST
jgi:hypothetical protein